MKRSAVAASLLLLAACGGEVRRPNLLLLSVDTLRADRVHALGAARGATPALDDLVASGVAFERAYATSSWTLPSIASVFTSLHPGTHRCWRQTSQLSPSFTTLAERLRGAGWDTAAVVSNHFLGRQHGLHQGFTQYGDELAQAALTPDLYRQVTAPQVAERAAEFLGHKAAAADGIPWFLWVHWFDPHAEYVPATPRYGEAPVDRYDAEVAATDAEVGRVLAVLAAAGLDEETVVVFLSDHGEEFGEHGGTDHGHTLHEELIRVPLVIRAPGLAPRRVADLASAVDVLPTVLALLGLPPAPGAEGRDLLTPASGASGALAELRLADGSIERALVGPRWKLIAREEEPGRVYDLAADPGERRALAEHDVPAAGALRVELRARAADAARRAAAFDAAPALDPSPLDERALFDLGYAGGG